MYRPGRGYQLTYCAVDTAPSMVARGYEILADQREDCV
jgi:hypothetical protein